MAQILILGGTGFVGRILTEELLKAEHRLTLFNRGKRNPGILPEAKRITGDRETGDIIKISSADWDVVIDFCGFFPDNIETITQLLKGKAGRYIFISSASVYFFDDPGMIKLPIKETNEVLSCTEEQGKNRNVYEFYGNKKAECERVLADKDWLDTIIFRPSLIYGRYDPSDRFYYWLYRVKNCGEILVPDGGKARSSNTYSEDFASLILEASFLKNHRKLYNANTQPAVSIKELIETASNLLKKSPQLISADPGFLSQKNVQPWSDLPMWIDGMDMLIDNSKLREDFSVRFHTFEESVERCIEYYGSLKWHEPSYGLGAGKEAELIREIKENRTEN